MSFPTQFSRKEKDEVFVSKSGDAVQAVYAYKFNEDGSKDLVIDSYEDLHAMIQADKDSCDINLMIARYVQGDSTALDKVKGIYADVTSMPKTYADMLQKVNDGQRYFEQLPAEIKQQFNNDPGQFWQSYGSDNFASIMQQFDDSFKDPKPIPDDLKESEVKSDVSV